MKKLFFMFALFGLFATSCEESNIQEPNDDNPIENPDGDNEEKPVFTVESDDTILIEADGGEFDVLVTTNLEYNVVIDKESQSWVSVADTRAVRKEKLTFTIAPNEEPEERSAIIRLTDKKGNTLLSFVIVQEAIEGIFEDDAKDKYTISADGGTVEVAVTTNLEYNVVIDKESQSWVSVADTRAVRKEKLTFTIAPNEEPEERSATIRLTDKKGNTLLSFVIVQEAFEGIFEDNAKDKYTISADGGTVEVAVTTNLEYSVVIDKESQSWVSVADTRAVRKEKLTFTIAPNEQYVSRVATISLIDKDKNTLETFTIEQHPASCASNELLYTSTDGQPIYVDVSAIGVVMTENIYENGVGVMRFNGIITTIPNQLFYDCKNLKSIILPDSVTTIGYEAFYYCTSLTSVTIPDSVTMIGGWAFAYCESLTSVTIPDSVTTIGKSAFAGCDSLKEFKGKFAADGGRCLIKDNTIIAYAEASGTTYTIPNSVTTIGDFAFYSCNSLTSVTIGNSVTTIGVSAFSWCESLTSVNIPDSVTTIGEEAFSHCTSLKTVYCKPTTPPTGGIWMFASNASDRKIYVPAGSVEAYKAKEYWSEYKDYIFAEGVESEPANDEIWYTNGRTTEPTAPYDPAAFGDATIQSNTYNAEKECWVIKFDKDLTTIGDLAFHSCSSLTSVNIGDSVTTIGEGAFIYCYSLTSVTIGNSVTTIGDKAFNKCNSLTSVTIPDSVTTIGEEAFSECDSLTSVTIGDSVTTIGEYAFWACFKLTSVTIGNSVTTIGNHAFYYCTSLTSVTIPDSVTTIGESAFDWCYSLTSVTIGDSVTTIGDYAFYGCDSLTSVTIPDRVKTIGYEAFRDCDSLASVTIGNSVTTIGDGAFSWCDSLTSVTIGDSVTTIGVDAFRSCDLTSVTIPDSVTTIGNGAFFNCTSLKTVYCKPTTPPTGGRDMFYNNASGRKIYVPAGSVHAYKEKEYWSAYADYIFAE